MSNDKLKCLLLNADYHPLKIISWKRAIVWSIKYEKINNYGIDILEYFENQFIQGCNNKTYPVPAVAKTRLYFQTFRRSIIFSRKNLFIRDDYTCQYCGMQLPHNQLTYDHIIPRCRFKGDKNATTWDNVTTACRQCNHKKGNKTPTEANMHLRTKPIAPKYSSKYLPWYTDLTTMIQNEAYNIWQPYITNIGNLYAS